MNTVPEPDPAPAPGPASGPLTAHAGDSASGTQVTGTQVTGAQVTEADLIAAAVLSCPQVAGLHGGRFGEAATYLPDRRVLGVRCTAAEVQVHFTARYPVTVADVDRAVRAAAQPYLSGQRFTITIEDYAPSAEPPTVPVLSQEPTR